MTLFEEERWIWDIEMLFWKYYSSNNITWSLHEKKSFLSSPFMNTTHADKTLHYYLYFQPNLSDMYELDVNRVHAIVSKMIINEELMASLDQPSQCIIMHK